MSDEAYSPSYTDCSIIDTAMLLLPLQLFDRLRLLVSADESEKASPGFKVAEEMVWVIHRGRMEA